MRRVLVALSLAITSMSAVTAQAAPVVSSANTLGGCRMFPADSPWNTRIDRAPVDPRSDIYIRNSGPSRNLSTSFSNERGRGEIPINIVGPHQRAVSLPPARQWMPDGPYPIPANPQVQRPADSHMLILQRGTCRLFELYAAERVDGRWQAKAAMIWDTRKNEILPPNVVSAVAAGTPMAAGLLNVRDARKREIKHALNTTLPYLQRAWVAPASHSDGVKREAGYLPMGARLRLKASVPIRHLPAQAKVIATAMKRYGLIVTDTSGVPDGHQYDGFELQGSYSPHWEEDARRSLYNFHLRDFEVVEMAGPIQQVDYMQLHDRQLRPMPAPQWQR